MVRPRTFRPRKVILYDINGRPVLKANLARHKRVQIPDDSSPANWPLVPGDYKLFFPDSGSRMEFALKDVRLKKGKIAECGQASACPMCKGRMFGQLRLAAAVLNRSVIALCLLWAGQIGWAADLMPRQVLTHADGERFWVAQSTKSLVRRNRLHYPLRSAPGRGWEVATTYP